jgi:hypothetical protein
MKSQFCFDFISGALWMTGLLCWLFFFVMLVMYISGTDKLEKLPVNVGEFWYVRNKDASQLYIVKINSIDQNVICIQKSEYASTIAFIEYGVDTKFVQKRKGGFK